jgi:hypothetical protein
MKKILAITITNGVSFKQSTDLLIIRIINLKFFSTVEKILMGLAN